MRALGLGAVVIGLFVLGGCCKETRVPPDPDRSGGVIVGRGAGAEGAAKAPARPAPPAPASAPAASAPR
ncbi:MAG TPA: hypothetical protein VGQ83_43015 [Polyangia bacterium]